MPGTEPLGSPGATPLDRRELGPDLARGAMLLLIALANVHTYLYARQIGVRGYPVDLSPLDRIVTLAQILLVDGRVYPLFGLLVGYGLARVAARAAAAGADPAHVRTLLLRRGGALVLIGAAHGVLLFSGDIIGAYGLVTLALAAPLAARNQFALGYAAVGGLVLAAMLGISAATPPEPPPTAVFPSRGMADPLDAAVARIGEWLYVGLFLQAFAVLAAVAFGAWVAERGVLQDPAAHRPLLRRVAVIGLAVGVVGGVPLALRAAGYWSAAPVGVDVAASVLHRLSGFAAAAGYLAVAALIAARQPRGPVATSLRACGQRSMTCYLAQSVFFVAILAPFAGGLGARISVAGAAVLAVGVWVVTVVASVGMARLRYRGPGEALLRRLTYGPRSR